MGFAVNDLTLNQYLDVPFDEYLSNVGAVSNSMLKLIDRSPAHLKSYIDDDSQREQSDALIVGRAAHAMVLETDSFHKYYYCIPDDLRKLTKPQIKGIEEGRPTKLAQELDDKWQHIQSEANGRELIKESSLSDVSEMRNALMKIPKIKALLSIGSAEQTRFFNDQSTGITCKMRADFVHGSTQSVIVDYKTCEDARPEAFAKNIVKFGYDVQAAHYKQGGQAEYFFIVAQEKKPPFAAMLYMMTSDWLVRGEQLRRKYLNAYAECINTNNWPSYTSKTETLTIPRWAEIG